MRNKRFPHVNKYRKIFLQYVFNRIFDIKIGDSIYLRITEIFYDTIC